MATLLDLSKRISNLAKSNKALASDVAKDFASLLVVRLTQETPVDTTKALSNWQVTLDNASAKEIDAHFPGSKKSTLPQSTLETRYMAQQVLKGKRIGQKIFVSNAASYIRDLNDGSSKQAPAGFIEAAVYSCRKEMPRILRAVRNGRKS